MSGRRDGGAVRVRPTRSRRCPSSRTTTTGSGASRTPASSQAGSDPSPRRGWSGWRLRGRGGRQALRQGLLARAQPCAEKLAGIRLVIAESFERIYRQNADNIGLFTSTDFGWSSGSRRGEPSRSRNLVAGPRCPGRGDPAQPAACCASAGSIPNEATAERARARARSRCSRRSSLVTLAARTSGSALGGRRGRLRARRLALHPRVLHRHGGAHADATFGPTSRCTSRSIVVFEDHTSYVEQSPAHGAPARAEHAAMCGRSADFVARLRPAQHGTLTEERPRRRRQQRAGISHAMMAEHYALPGQVVVGTDSHTPHSGALGCVAFGVGTTDMANALVTGRAPDRARSRCASS